MSPLHSSVVSLSIGSVSQQTFVCEEDELCVEEPLEIRVELKRDGSETTRPLAVTMRTPGSDEELAAGFLLSEGIVQGRNQIQSIRQLESNIVVACLAPSVDVPWSKMQRHSFVSSSCGVCGKRSIAAVFGAGAQRQPLGTPRFEAQVIHGLGRAQRARQANFRRTGGLHAAALFDTAGNIQANSEDVGRHNALDKLIGGQLLANRLPLRDNILLLSGRACFELIQKASMAGIPIVAAIGAPTSLAVSLAKELGITLLGFVRDERFNVYADAGRLVEAPSDLFTNFSGSVRK
ncbi:formate dehydrogenase accessory sulfurtransferase FdhD [Blastopirellula marina]|uniref:Sulfur carrier protein FdhD n=1 Tax=Blastopirellula marina TaxID=124 RepID=A0A2S8FNB3_9BACT|nr:formate dehydrogenase accessory sulfurtransferase FdhD [Blastopirellula marina]PQO33682.1 formate dehydrogenase accessory sulfurtransferase FdhD [Blastopirellula marina]PTL43469.1 formate dehydrogenase accessory sulfurtransferase FdhD [Blastopirellula marina]